MTDARTPNREEIPRAPALSVTAHHQSRESGPPPTCRFARWTGLQPQQRPPRTGWGSRKRIAAPQCNQAAHPPMCVHKRQTVSLANQNQRGLVFHRIEAQEGDGNSVS
eukprot:313273-Pelagomonas_calceolata.AAC.1